MRALIALVAILAATAVSRADEPSGPPISDDKVRRANELAQEANQLFGEQKYPEALAKYTQALGLLDHPTLHLNIAVTLIRLDRFLEASDHLDAAAGFGPDAFPEDKYGQLLDYKKLVGRQVSTVSVKCSQSGSAILDGKTWFTCPGERTQKVLSGEHVVVVEGPGYIPQTRRLVLAGGASKTADITLVPIESAVTYQYPTRRWIPWSVAIGGAVVALAGVPVWVVGRSEFDEFEKQYALTCAERCKNDLSDQPLLRNQHDSATFKGRAAATMMVVGGTAAVAGVVWALAFNQARKVLPVVEATPSGAVAAGVHFDF